MGSLIPHRIHPSWCMPMIGQLQHKKLFYWKKMENRSSLPTRTEAPSNDSVFVQLAIVKFELYHDWSVETRWLHLTFYPKFSLDVWAVDGCQYVPIFNSYGSMHVLRKPIILSILHVVSKKPMDLQIQFLVTKTGFYLLIAHP